MTLTELKMLDMLCTSSGVTVEGLIEEAKDLDESDPILETVNTYVSWKQDGKY